MAGARLLSEEKTYGEGSTFCQRINTYPAGATSLLIKWELDPRVMCWSCAAERQEALGTQLLINDLLCTRG